MNAQSNQPDQTISTDTCARMLFETIPPLMRMLHGLMRRNCQDDEAPNFGQMRMLGMLRERAWMLSDLAERHHVAPSTMSRSVDILERRGWVQRTSAADDRRKVLLTLTEAGRAMHTTLAEQSRSAAAELMASLSEHDRATLVAGLEVLQRIARTAHESTEEEQRDS